MPNCNPFIILRGKKLWGTFWTVDYYTGQTAVNLTFWPKQEEKENKSDEKIVKQFTEVWRSNSTGCKVNISYIKSTKADWQSIVFFHRVNEFVLFLKRIFYVENYNDNPFFAKGHFFRKYKNFDFKFCTNPKRDLIGTYLNRRYPKMKKCLIELLTCD